MSERIIDETHVRKAAAVNEAEGLLRFIVFC